ncbi:MAG: hypothetical protein QXM16_06070 [Nitrososphaerota archaeon]
MEEVDNTDVEVVQDESYGDVAGEDWGVDYESGVLHKEYECEYDEGEREGLRGR